MRLAVPSLWHGHGSWIGCSDGPASGRERPSVVGHVRTLAPPEMSLLAKFVSSFDVKNRTVNLPAVVRSAARRPPCPRACATQVQSKRRPGRFDAGCCRASTSGACDRGHVASSRFRASTSGTSCSWRRPLAPPHAVLHAPAVRTPRLLFVLFCRACCACGMYPVLLSRARVAVALVAYCVLRAGGMRGALQQEAAARATARAASPRRQRLPCLLNKQRRSQAAQFFHDSVHNRFGVPTWRRGMGLNHGKPGGAIMEAPRITWGSPKSPAGTIRITRLADSRGPPPHTPGGGGGVGSRLVGGLHGRKRGLGFVSLI